MRIPEVLQRISSALDRAEIAYMLTGSFAGAYYGSLRSTQDIDLVISGSELELKEFFRALPDDEYYADLSAALDAFRRESLFNVIDLKSGWKIDMIIRKSRPFSLEEFRRRRRVNMTEASIFVASPEDVILSKIEWAKLGRSQRQIEDAAAILKIHQNSLDRRYLEKWVEELILQSEWQDALRVASIPWS
jgi:hypothetical protein